MYNICKKNLISYEHRTILAKTILKCQKVVDLNYEKLTFSNQIKISKNYVIKRYVIK